MKTIFRKAYKINGIQVPIVIGCVNHSKYGELPAFIKANGQPLTDMEEIKNIIRELQKTYTKLTYEEIKEIEQLYLSEAYAKTEPLVKKDKKIIKGYVYFLKYNKYYKIGKSIDVEKRKEQIGLQMPEKSIIVHTVETNDYERCERFFHKRFKRKKENGEWFTLNEQDLVTIKKIKIKNFKLREEVLGDFSI